MFVSRDPKDSALSWQIRYQRINGNDPTYADVKSSTFPMWLSKEHDNNGVAYENWCIDNLPVEDYVIDFIQVETKRAPPNFVGWQQANDQRRYIVIWFTRDTDAMMFKLANNDLIIGSPGTIW